MWHSSLSSSPGRTRRCPQVPGSRPRAVGGSDKGGDRRSAASGPERRPPSLSGRQGRREMALGAETSLQATRAADSGGQHRLRPESPFGPIRPFPGRGRPRLGPLVASAARPHIPLQTPAARAPSVTQAEVAPPAAGPAALTPSHPDAPLYLRVSLPQNGAEGGNRPCRPALPRPTPPLGSFRPAPQPARPPAMIVQPAHRGIASRARPQSLSPAAGPRWRRKAKEAGGRFSLIGASRRKETNAALRGAGTQSRSLARAPRPPGLTTLAGGGEGSD